MTKDMRLYHFNPRLREGGDQELIDNLVEAYKFQSTPPRRRRQWVGIYNINQIRISIHASAKEATLRTVYSFTKYNISIHASAKEATGLFHTSKGYITISIHASAKEATRSVENVIAIAKISIHASAKEATATYCDTSAIMYISSLNNFFVHFF